MSREKNMMKLKSPCKIEEKPSFNLAVYITKNFLQARCKTPNLSLVTNLNISGDTHAPYSIKFLENLHFLPNLVYLNLSKNDLSSMNGLASLKHLRNLDLSFNRIETINCNELHGLHSLERLDLTGNCIKFVPTKFKGCFPKLRSLHLASNQINSLSSVYRLVGLSDLSELDVRDNPFVAMNNHRLLIVFHLRTLDVLDGEVVTTDELERASLLYGKGEATRLANEASQMEARLLELTADNARLNSSLQEEKAKHIELQEENTRKAEKLEETSKRLASMESEKRRASQLFNVREQERFWRESAEFERCFRIGEEDEIKDLTPFLPCNLPLAEVKARFFELEKPRCFVRKTRSAADVRSSQPVPPSIAPTTDACSTDAGSPDSFRAIRIGTARSPASGNSLHELSRTLPSSGYRARLQASLRRPGARAFLHDYPSEDCPSSSSSSRAKLLERTPSHTIHRSPAAEAMATEETVLGRAQGRMLPETSTPLRQLPIGVAPTTCSDSSDESCTVACRSNRFNRGNVTFSEGIEMPAESSTQERLVVELGKEISSLRRRLRSNERSNEARFEHTINRVVQMRQAEAEQADLRHLREQLGSSEAACGQLKKELETSSNRTDEMNELLEKQRQEISRLTGLLDMLVGGNPEKPIDLRQQSMPDIFTAASMPDVNFACVPLSRRFFCNVDRHHRLEDDFESVGAKNADLKKQLKEAHRSSQQNLNSLSSMQTELAQRTSELQAVARQLDESRMEARQLTKQLEVLREERDRLVGESRQAEVEARSFAKQREKLDAADAALTQRRTELAQAESDLAQARQNVSLLKTETQSATLQFQAALEAQRNASSKTSEMESQLRHTVADLQGLKTRLASSAVEVNELVAAKGCLQQTVRELSSLKNDAGARCNVMEGRVRETTDRLVAAERELSVAETRVHDRRTQLHECERAIDSRRLELDELTNRVGEERCRLVATSAQLAQRSAQVQSEESAAVERLAELRDRVSREQQAVEHLASACEKQQRSNEQLLELHRLEQLKLEDASKQLGATLASQTQAKHQLNAVEEALRSATEQKAAKDVEVAKLDQQLRSMQLSADALERENQAKADRLEILKNETADLAKREVDLHHSVASATEKLTDLAARADQENTKIDAIRKRQLEEQKIHDDLNKSLMQLRIENENFQQRVSQCKETLKSSESDLEALRDQKARLQDELRGLDTRLAASRAQAQAAEEQRQVTQASLTDTQAELTQLKATKDRFKTEYDAWTQQVQEQRAKLESELARVTADLQSTKDDLSAKISRLDKAEARCEEVERIVAERQATMDACRVLQKQNDLLENQLSGLRATHERELQQVASQNQNELSHLRAKFQAQRNELNLTAQHLKASARNLKRVRKRANREIAELERIAEEQCSRAGALTEQLSTTRRHYAQLRSQIATYGILMDEVFSVVRHDRSGDREKRLHEALAAVRSELAHDLQMHGAVRSQPMIPSATLVRPAATHRHPSGNTTTTSSSAQANDLHQDDDDDEDDEDELRKTRSNSGGILEEKIIDWNSGKKRYNMDISSTPDALLQHSVIGMPNRPASSGLGSSLGPTLSHPVGGQTEPLLDEAARRLDKPLVDCEWQKGDADVPTTGDVPHREHLDFGSKRDAELRCELSDILCSKEFEKLSYTLSKF